MNRIRGQHQRQQQSQHRRGTDDQQQPEAAEVQPDRKQHQGEADRCRRGEIVPDSVLLIDGLSHMAGVFHDQLRMKLGRVQLGDDRLDGAQRLVVTAGSKAITPAPHHDAQVKRIAVLVLEISGAVAGGQLLIELGAQRF